MKIRTDFVTNSSSSSFTLVISIEPKKGRPIQFTADGGVGEGFEEYYELVATKDPGELAASESIEALVRALKESVGQDGIYGEGPALEKNRILMDDTPFIKKIRQLSSMDEIKKISISGTLEGRNDAYWHQYFSYDMETGETQEEEEGEDFDSEGTGGALRFQKAYGGWENIDGRTYYGTKKQIRDQYEKQQEEYSEYKEQMEEFLQRSFDEYLDAVNKDFEYRDYLFGDVDVIFSGKKFTVDPSEFSPEISNEITLRGGRVFSGFGKTSDYFVVNLSEPDKYYFPEARYCIKHDKDIKVITEYQVWKSLLQNKDIGFAEKAWMEEEERRLWAELRNRISREESARREKDIEEWKDGMAFSGPDHVQWTDWMLSAEQQAQLDSTMDAFYAPAREETRKYLQEDAQVVFADKVFVLTGFDQPLEGGESLEDKVIDEIEKRGGRVHDSMVKTADYLVINMRTPGSSKLKKAIEWEKKGFPKIIISNDRLYKAFREIPPQALYEISLKYLREQARTEKRKESQLRRQQAAQEKEARALERKQKQEERMLAEQEKLKEKTEARKQKEAERLEAALAAEKRRKEKEALQEEARANANVLYAPGEEPERLHNRIQTLMMKLDEAYPDHVLVNLNKDHKKWGETITELYRALGYADNVSFLEAYGFKMNSDRGGRPTTLNPEAVIEELKRRYPDGTNMKMAELMAENKDLPLKTLSNSATQLLGMGLGKYLKQIGVMK